MPTDPISAAEASKIRHHDDTDMVRPQAADDHLENHLLNEENTRLKDELRRVESALRVAARVLGPYLVK
jgi:hypothetical protein